MKIAIQGIRGSFHHQAAKELFTGYDYTLVECVTFRDVFNAVNSGDADYGMVAVENSLHGSVNQVYRLLASEGLQICGEVRLHINLYLIGHDDHGLDMVNVPMTVVSSQREALNQCEQWLADHLPHAKIAESSDTALAVQNVMQEKDAGILAVGSKQAADVYGATIIAGPINDEPENYTRFFAITNKSQITPDANRTSIIIQESVQDKAGTLHDALGVFARYNVSLSKLDSHTLPGKERRYAFYIDFEAAAESETGRNILTELKQQGWKLQLLGSYKH